MREWSITSSILGAARPVTRGGDDGAGRPTGHEYVPQLDEMLARHPDTDVVWCHAGVARRIEPHDQAAVVGSLLARHRRLHIDVSWSLVDRIVDAHGDGADPNWVALIDEFPDRFVLGSDSVAAPRDAPARLARLDPLLDAVSDPHRELLAAGNAERLWFRSEGRG